MLNLTVCDNLENISVDGRETLKVLTEVGWEAANLTDWTYEGK
jgi:hypothetical protein